MKAILQRFLALVKTLFMKLRVVVTLQLGHGKVDQGADSCDEQAQQKGESDDK